MLLCAVCGGEINDLPRKVICSSHACRRVWRNALDRASMARSRERQLKASARKRVWEAANPDKVRRYAEIQAAKYVPKPRYCEVCKISLPFHLRTKTCSPLCRDIRSPPRPPKSYYIPLKRQCTVCGETFSGRQAAKACNEKCSKELNLRLRKSRRQLAAACAAALIEMKVIDRPPGLSKHERKEWNSRALTAAKSLNLVVLGATP